MAWEDRTTFETIWERVGVVEADVIRIMRAQLTPSSFKMWRKRVKGRVTKHRALRNPAMKFADIAVADHCSLSTRWLHDVYVQYSEHHGAKFVQKT